MAIKGTRILVLLAGAGILSSATIAQAQQHDKSVDSVSNSFRLSGSALANPSRMDRVHAKRYGRLTSLRFQESQEEGAGEDDVSRRQSIDAFTSLEDGQPGEPGDIELELNLGWQTNSDQSDPVEIETEFEYTLDGNDFLRNTQINLSVPLELGNGEIEGNADITMGWQQRWVSEGDGWPTLATLAEIRVPSGDNSEGVDGTLTGILAKDVGPGTAYVNSFLKTANGDNEEEDTRNFQWGFRAGYKWRLDDALSVIANYVHTASEERGEGNNQTLELSGEYRLSDDLTIGPGIVIGLNHNDEVPNFGAGVRLQFSF